MHEALLIFISLHNLVTSSILVLIFSIIFSQGTPLNSHSVLHLLARFGPMLTKKSLIKEAVSFSSICRPVFLSTNLILEFVDFFFEGSTSFSTVFPEFLLIPHIII